jgi:elongation factor 1-alpha
MSEKEHVSIVVCGHVDSGKSTTTGHLIFELGGINEREMQRLKDEAKRLGKDSFAFAFYMDTTKEERERGVTIACQTKEFFTPNYHYTIIDAPGHRDFMKNMITGASQADVAMVMVPADGNFTTSIAKGDRKKGEVKGQTREHARLINLLGVKQLIIGVNKMDAANYSEEKFEEIRDEMKNMLVRVGWPKQFVEKAVPIIPVSGWKGDNLVKDSENMPWWKGVDVVNPRTKETVHVNTLHDALDKMVKLPPRPSEKPLRIPISQVLKIKGVGDVLTGRVEQGTVRPGDEVKFVPSNTATNACTGKIFAIEMHHKPVPSAGPGDNVGLNVKGLDKFKPKTGDIMILKKDDSLAKCNKFVAQVQVLDHPGELKTGYCPIVFCRTGHSACKISAINWRMGKDTGGAKAEEPPFIKAGDMAEVEFTPQQPFCVEDFKSCEGLARIAVIDGNEAVFLGKVVSFE